MGEYKKKEWYQSTCAYFVTGAIVFSSVVWGFGSCVKNISEAEKNRAIEKKTDIETIILFNNELKELKKEIEKELEEMPFIEPEKEKEEGYEKPYI